MNNKGIKDTIYICLNCEVEFGFKGYSVEHKFCKARCQHDYRLKERRARDKSLFEKGQLTNRKEIYLLLVERDGNCCSVCKITEHNGKPLRLWVDHIDGDATNNFPINFRLICPNCDSQSDTFGAKNTGNGRKAKGLPQYG